MNMSEPLHCINHPNVETYLRCNKCGQPMCSKCAVQTPVGYRCKSCISAQQQIFYADFRPVHYVVAAAVALPLSLVAGAVIPALEWFAIFLGPVAGTGIAEITRWAIRRRRGRYVWVVVCGSIVIGGLLPVLAVAGLASFLWIMGGMSDAAPYALGGLFGILWPIVYVVTATGAAYWRLRPGKRV
jgi:NADH:ubiquinone oxidoreductase subunit H